MLFEAAQIPFYIPLFHLKAEWVGATQGEKGSRGKEGEAEREREWGEVKRHREKPNEQRTLQTE